MWTCNRSSTLLYAAGGKCAWEVKIRNHIISRSRPRKGPELLVIHSGICIKNSEAANKSSLIPEKRANEISSVW